MRGIASRAQGTGTERFVAILRKSATGDVAVDPLVPVTETYQLSGSFGLAPQPGWLGRWFLSHNGSWGATASWRRAGRTDADAHLPDTESTPCYAGQQEETLPLALPEGRRPDRLPQDR